MKWQTTHSGYGYWVDYRIAQLDGALMEDGSFIATGIPRDPSVKQPMLKPMAPLTSANSGSLAQGSVT